MPEPHSPTGRLRDARVDFFRGLALIFIFIDHIPDNTWAHATLKNFGFADASEVFVFLSGYSAALAYCVGRDGAPIRPDYQRAMLRAGRIYLWHIAIFAISAAMLYAAAAVFAEPVYVYNIWLQNLSADPIRWVFYALTLTYQPNQMNILPLYVVLMLWLPVILALLRRGVVPALVLSAGIWAIANQYALNLPANNPGDGWFFNPFAWQLLFTTGAAFAVCAHGRHAFDHPVTKAAAALYVAFSFIYAAPWVPIAWLPDQALLPANLIGSVNKHNLSPWRFFHVLALALIVSCFVPRSAPWLERGWARAIALCGRNALEVFALGTLLSFVAWIVLNEAGWSSASQHFVVSVAGIAAMGFAARRISEQKAGRATTRAGLVAA
ncbi:MAG: OpgC family protein [Hyphomicrobium sp.]